MSTSTSGSGSREESLKHFVEGDDGVLVVVHDLVHGVLQDQVVDLLGITQLVLQLRVLVYLLLHLEEKQIKYILVSNNPWSITGFLQILTSIVPVTRTPDF